MALSNAIIRIITLASLSQDVDSDARTMMHETFNTETCTYEDSEILYQSDEVGEMQLVDIINTQRYDPEDFRSCIESKTEQELAILRLNRRYDILATYALAALQRGDMDAPEIAQVRSFLEGHAGVAHQEAMAQALNNTGLDFTLINVQPEPPVAINCTTEGSATICRRAPTPAPY